MGNAAPEHILQMAVKRFLLVALPPQVEWTASLAGAHLSVSQRTKAKAAGLRPGWPDLQFLIPTSAGWATRYIELKAERGRASEDQARILSKLGAHAAVCRSVEEVEAALRGWGVKLRASTQPIGQLNQTKTRAEAGLTGNGGASVVGVPAASAHPSIQDSHHEKEGTTTC